jgi:hypothetical protein
MLKTLFAGLALALSTRAAAPAVDYSGHWTLDAARSRNLPGFYARVRSHRLDVTQDAARLDVAVTIDAGGPRPDRIDLSYALDGHPVETQTFIRMQNGPVAVPTTLRARVDEAGAVHVTLTRRIPAPDGTEVTAEGTEDWQLGADGKTLTIHRVERSPMGGFESDMVFARS